MRHKLRLHALFSLAILVGSLGVGAAAVADGMERASWISSAEPAVSKQAELTPNQEPMSRSVDCIPETAQDGDGTRIVCSEKTPLGTMADGRIIDGSRGDYPYDPWYGGLILPSVPGHPDLLLTKVSPRSWSSGYMIRVGTYDASQLKYAEYSGLPAKKVYEYRGYTGTPLKDRAGNILNFWSGEVAHSQNGDWLAGSVGGKGIALYNVQSNEAKIITWDAPGYSTSSGYQKTNNITVSDDGRYVAVTLSVPSGSTTRPALRVYDTLSCRDQYANYSEPSKHNGCEFKDLWTGEYRTGNSGGLRDMLPTAEYPRRVRFVANNTLVFDTIYDRTNTSTFKVARYSVSMTQKTAREYVGVLGMGDSYISGEGAAGTYFEGTDTKQNKCHLSWFSYPYRVGAIGFPYGRSVACSGAKMLDVTIAAGDLDGGTASESKYQGQVKNKTDWNKRDRDAIIVNFAPGYANQTIFAETYTPRTILLSIGGNDVGFAQIITSCVNVFHTDDCFNYYEDRVELMQSTLDQYDRLVKTYKDVAQKSHGRVYVVGYPQIAKPGGNCGSNVRLNADEVVFGSQLISYLNSVIKRAAEEAGVYYIDTETALNGYRLCESSPIAVNGLTKGNDSALVIGNESYHPTAFGHKLLGGVIMTKTNNLTTPMPSPKKNNKPALNTNSDMLVGRPKLNRPVRVVRWVDGAMRVVAGKTYALGKSLAGNARADIVAELHSTPTVLYSGPLPQDGILVTIPSGFEPGFHTLHVYTVDENGQKVDHRQVVYVAATETDDDGDELNNAVDPCVVVPQSGEDIDQDGLDDICDGLIGSDPEAAAPPPEPSPTSPGNFDSTDDESVASDSLLTIYTPPMPQTKPTEEKTPSQTQKAVGTQPDAAPISLASTSSSLAPKATAHQPNYGHILTPRVGENTVSVLGVNDPLPVAGGALLAAKQPAQQPRGKDSGRSAFVYVGLAGALSMLYLFALLFRRRRV